MNDDLPALDEDLDELIVEFLKANHGKSYTMSEIKVLATERAQGRVSDGQVIGRLLDLRSRGFIMVAEQGRLGRNKRGKFAKYRIRTDEDNKRVVWPTIRTSSA